MDDISGNPILPPLPVESSVTGISPQQPTQGGISAKRLAKKEYERQRYIKNRDHILAKSGAWKAANKERYTVTNKLWAQSHRPQIAKAAKVRYRRNPDKAWQSNHSPAAIARKRKWVEEHREQVRATNKAWKKRNPAKVKASSKRSYEKNSERRRLLARERWIKNHEKELARLCHKNHKRRIRVKTGNNPASIVKFIESIRKKRWVKCFHCDKKISGRKCHIDHITPLAKGGTHSAENLGPSCPKCNLSKSAKTLSQWNESKQGQLILL